MQGKFPDDGADYKTDSYTNHDLVLRKEVMKTSDIHKLDEYFCRFLIITKNQKRQIKSIYFLERYYVINWY